MGQQPDQALLEPIYTVPEIASALRVSVVTVHRLIAAGTIAAFRVGREWRITKTAWGTYCASLGLAPAISDTPITV